MQVYLTCAFPGTPTKPSDWAYRWFLESAAEDPFGQHQLTEDPERADIIVFAEYRPYPDTYLLTLKRHPLYRKYRDKCFVYDDDDCAVAVMRGIYPSIRKRDYLIDRCRSTGYIDRVVKNEAVCYDSAPRTRKWLYSFFGEANSEVRRAIFAQAHREGFIRDTTGIRMWAMEPGPEKSWFISEYAETILDSKFVLCPAGFGPSTYRLYETMEMGRAPVIISDQWVPPPGPLWSEFSVRIPERLVHEVPSILHQVSDRHEVMGRQARLAWEEWFSKPVCFHRLVELCVDLKRTPRRPFSALRAWGTLLRPPHLINWIRPYYQVAIRKLSCNRRQYA